MATLRVEIVSPEVALWAGEATALIARSSEGFFTILPEHTDTIGDLVPGLVRVDTLEGRSPSSCTAATSKWSTGRATASPS